LTQFSDLNLDPRVLQALTDSGYVTPTPIQADAIPPALEGRDVLGIAQTGTGQDRGLRAAHDHPPRQGRARARMPRSLVLCPTRELAAQVAENFDKYTQHLKLSKALLIGGVSFKDQDLLIDRGVDVLIATPGRLLDHFERGKLLLTGVQIMVVDEADRMLDMGFIPDIERIFSLTPFTRQTFFFSATMAPEIERITKTFLSNPAKVEVARAATTAENIAQALVEFKPTGARPKPREARRPARADRRRGRGPHQRHHLLQPQGGRGHRRQVAQEVRLRRRGDPRRPRPVAAHADAGRLPGRQAAPPDRLGRRRPRPRHPAVSHVFNFDVPSHSEDYVHRIGRTGRAGRSGKALTICAPKDEKYLEPSRS
jgi:superfamily II DNA/RNA helicase